MKRLITTLFVTLGFVFAQVGSAAAVTRYWKVDIFDPAASTVNRTLNVEYKVFSTVKEDNTYSVKLMQNGTQVGDTQNIFHPEGYGDSGVFSVSIPSTGTYTYQVVATNVNASEELPSETKTVQVVDGPAPTVTTVFVNNAGAAGGGGQGAGGAAAGAQAAAAPAGQVAGAAAQEGQVSGEAATDNQEGGVLGATERAAATNNRGRNTAIGVVVAVAILGGAYYWFLARPRNSA